MFKDCANLTDVTIDSDAKLTEATLMFYGCRSLQTFSMNTKHIVIASSIFTDCTSLENVQFDAVGGKCIIDVFRVYRNSEYRFEFPYLTLGRYV